MIKRIVIMVVLLAAVAGGLVGFNLFRDKMIGEYFANMPTPPVTVSTIEAKPVTWTPTIDAIGTVSALRGVELTVEASGVIGDIRFGPSEAVTEGQVLLQLDDAVQSADLEAARTQAELDQQNLVRARELVSRGATTTVTLESAVAAAAASRAQVAKLEAVLEKRQLLAPFSGTIGLPRVDLGAYVTPGTVVATLQDLSRMRVDFTVPEQRLGELRIGQPIVVRDEERQSSFEGEIVGIDPRVDPATRLVSVRASIDNPDGRLTPGQFVRISVVLPEESGVIAMPLTAVVSSLYGDYVFVVRPRENDPEQLEVRQVFVQTGRRSGQMVEIVSGVQVGDAVVTAGQNRLTNGAPARVDNSVNPAADMIEASLR
ncbi:efflux RND transporter periplasmic adaptor subunit [Halovulum dunhuangense]|uniref:Efflux RND transporter periplasmic adaptor subunit n=1 Tax=Halovulum dunhuangense TaxID=1505036 RepID=A0A849L269_9RHOB|nr:efflux RND transporter periplasmic adaptor subunit [Halovulum dunhuangense]NNU80317.1 efflux RND transporter periplasmic adaptor subunit [Halovulum dunhuangense]